MHENWYGYMKVHVNGKVAAKCLNCSKTFLNTAKIRLDNHQLVENFLNFLLRISLLFTNFMSNFVYSKRCSSLNVQTKKLADTEHDQSMNDGSDNDIEMTHRSAEVPKKKM